MALGKRLINTGAAAAACSTDSVQAFGADAAYSSNIALYELNSDGGITDFVPDTTLTYDGIASNVTYATGHIGNAAVFNGSSSYINLGDPTSGITTANYSISFWVNTTSTSTSYLISKYLTDGLDSTDVFRVMNLSGGTISFRTSTFGGGSARDITSTTSINDGNWHHILFTVTPSTSKLYIDGTQEGGDSTLYTAVTPSTVTRNVTVGRHDAGDNYFNGKIDQVRIFDKAISAEDVATLYAETSSTASNTNPLSEGSGVALYSLDYDASEASGYYDGTPTNVEFGVGGKINYGARFNGSSSYIDTGATLLGQTYTVSLWFNANTITSSSDGDTLYAQYDSADVGRHIVSIYNGNLRIFVGGQTVQTISTTWSTSTWTHLVVVKNSSGYEAFVNGSSIGTSSLTASIDVTENTMIGGDDGLAGYGFDGSLDQVRIFSKALDETTNGEISALYAETACVYECTTDDVNYPFSDGTNVEAYYKLDNSSEDYVGGNDGSDTNVEYRFGRFGQAAVFNGSSSKIVTTADFDGSTSGGSSISFWFKTTQTTAKTLFGSDTTQGGAGQGSTIYIGPASGSFADESISFWDFNGSTTSVFYAKGGSTYYQDGNWHHCTIISTSSSKQIWIDGQSQTVYYFSSGSASANAKLTDIIIGDDDTGGGFNFNGSIDQVRLYSTALTSSQVTQLYEEKPCADTSNFKTVLWEGTGSTQYISNVGMDLETDGGLVWIKSRTDGTHWHILHDSIRGAGNRLFSNTTNAESYYAASLQSFDKNGFTVGADSDINANGDDHVAWVWRANKDAVNIGVNSITASTPSIASDVSANTEAGFSIVKYTGNTGVDQTVGTGLTTPCDIVIVKRLTDSGYSWCVGGSVVGNGNNLYLDSSGELLVRDRIKSVQSETFTVEQVHEVNNTGKDYIAYCWHSVAEYSKMGSYSGGSSGSSNVIVTGFKPSFLMVKRTDQAGDAWQMFDIVRGGSDTFDNYLQADNSSAEVSYSAREVTFANDGFYWTNAESGTNISGGTYIYMAFK